MTVCDGKDNSNGVTIGAVVGAFCVVIIIMVITNIMVWINCFRKRHHTGMYLLLSSCVAMYVCIYVRS